VLTVYRAAGGPLSTHPGEFLFSGEAGSHDARRAAPGCPAKPPLQSEHLDLADTHSSSSRLRASATRRGRGLPNACQPSPPSPYSVFENLTETPAGATGLRE